MRYSKWDAVLVGLSVAHATILLAAPSVPVVALGLWWNANTISHNFVHLPFFRFRWLNRLYSVCLTVLLGFPQSVWRLRHIRHHRGRPGAGLKWSRLAVLETFLVFTLWGFLAVTQPQFFLMTYLPGYAAGLGLCFIHGHYEHARGTISHYGRFYNLWFFNDGYHVEHHLRPRTHWTELPALARSGAVVSRWPAVFRWMESISLESLERLALRSRMLQSFLLRTHERAFRVLLPELGPIRTVKVVGGGMFPRTSLILRKLLPDAELTIVDASVEHIETAKAFLDGRIHFVHAKYDAGNMDSSDLIVIPLSFKGDRAAMYASRTAGSVLIHDWIWARHPKGARVSFLLFKRLNLVRP